MKAKELLDLYDESTQGDNGPERALFHFLRHHEKAIALTLETDPEYFHKSFRQCDVLGSGDEDMVAWCLLQKAPKFWAAFQSLLPPPPASNT